MKPKSGYDARTRKPVVVVAEVGGCKLFSGRENRPISTAARKRLAKGLLELCKAQGIRPAGLGLSLASLGHELLVESKRSNPEGSER